MGAGARALVDLAGFALHVAAVPHSPHDNLSQAVLCGAPPFAPLLFCDLAVPAAGIRN